MLRLLDLMQRWQTGNLVPVMVFMSLCVRNLNRAMHFLRMHLCLLINHLRWLDSLNLLDGGMNNFGDIASVLGLDGVVMNLRGVVWLRLGLLAPGPEGWH